MVGVEVPQVVVAEYEHGPAARAGEVVEPRGLGCAELAAIGAGDDGVDDGERHAVDVHVVGRVAGRELGIGLHVMVAAHPLHALAERAVRAEEGFELVLRAGVGEVALDDDHVGIEAAHLVDHRAVHHLGVRRISRLCTQDRAQLLLPQVADASALDLPEVHVVGRRDRGQEAAVGTLERRERRREPVARLGAIDVEDVLGARVQARDTRAVVRAPGGDLGVADARGDRLVAVGAERDHGFVRPDGHELGVVHHRHRAARVRPGRDGRSGPTGARARGADRRAGRSAATRVPRHRGAPGPHP